MRILKGMAGLLTLAILSVFAPSLKAQGGTSSQVRNGANLPTCNANIRWSIFVKTTGNVGVYVCHSDNTWHGFGIGAANQIAVYDSTGVILIGNTRLTDNGTTLTYTGTGGASFSSMGVTDATQAGNIGLGQGPTATAGTCQGVACIKIQGPAAVNTSGVYTFPAQATPGLLQFGQPTANVVPGYTSGDASHSDAQVNQTASIATKNLCPSATGGCNTSGQYIVFWTIRSSLACATPGPAGVTLTLGWTDDVGAKTFIVPQTGTGSSGTSVALGTTTGFGQGSFVMNSTGAAAITYATTLAACTTGTATYNVQLSTVQTD